MRSTLPFGLSFRLAFGLIVFALSASALPTASAERVDWRFAYAHSGDGAATCATAGGNVATQTLVELAVGATSVRIASIERCSSYGEGRWTWDNRGWTVGAAHESTAAGLSWKHEDAQDHDYDRYYLKDHHLTAGFAAEPAAASFTWRDANGWTWGAPSECVLAAQARAGDAPAEASQPCPAGPPPPPPGAFPTDPRG